ncbi:MAG: type II toxin-antitoxin system Phd/YefM family antitoxin [Chloroflexi bacterium]|nr:type II toxin-antitoxin system Phd/YefM family antitoxin [Chloroflexota bacterium]
MKVDDIMERTIGAFDARRQFGRVLNEVVAKGDCYVVERHGEPIAAAVPIQIYEQWERSREAFFDRMEAIGQRVHLPGGGSGATRPGGHRGCPCQICHP